MPVLTDAQSYAADVLRLLHCMRRRQIHFMLGRKFPQVTPEKIMRQLVHILRVYDDGEYYRWPGTEPNPERAAVEVMLLITKNALPIPAEVARSPRTLLFFIPVPESCGVLAYRVYTPQQGGEEECRTMAESEQRPKGHAAVFVIADKSQIPLLRVSHPHIFAIRQQDGTYDFYKPKD